MNDQPVSGPTLMWEQRYGEAHYVFGTEPNDFLRAQLPMLPRGRVLCLAEGEGRNAVFLAEAGFEVHSVDLTEAGVVKTLQLAADRGVTVHARVGDLAAVPIGLGEWNVIVSIFAHMPPNVRRDLHRRVAAALAPDGMLLLEAYTPDQVGRGTGGPHDPALTMTLAGLRDELQPLEFVHGLETVRDVVEGVGHTGPGAVVQVVARKR